MKCVHCGYRYKEFDKIVDGELQIIYDGTEDFYIVENVNIEQEGYIRPMAKLVICPACHIAQLCGW